MSAVAIGVDVGSTTWKGVVIGKGGVVLARHLEPTHPRLEEQTARGLAALRAAAGADLATPIAATGYGRKRVLGARALTEITCHARGAFALTHAAGLLVDVGGQDTKVIRVGAKGEVIDFAMNDKCAAGTGRFLEVILARLQVPLATVAEEVARATHAVSVSSTCTVFAESEVVSLVAQGEPLEGIVKGLHQALAARVAALSGRMRGEGPVMMSGGVAHNGAMVQCLAAAMKAEVRVVPEPQLVGALGAALSLI